MEADQPVAKKVYYSIGEVCDLSGLKPHVLRYWETQFDVLNPTKNRAGAGVRLVKFGKERSLALARVGSLDGMLAVMSTDASDG